MAGELSEPNRRIAGLSLMLVGHYLDPNPKAKLHLYPFDVNNCRICPFKSKFSITMCIYTYLSKTTVYVDVVIVYLHQLTISSNNIETLNG